MRYLPRLLSFLTAFVLVALSLTAHSPVLAATLPAGFVDEVVVGGLLAPRAFAFTPDGRVLVVERGSASSTDANIASIRVFKNGTLLSTRAYTVNTCGDSERGLLGITVDPNFVTNGYIYIYYTRQATSGAICAKTTFANGNNGGPRNRISRLTMSGDMVTPSSERVLIDSIVTDQGNHNAGDLHFGADGYLYASTGDGALRWTSPDKNTLNGKIIRILPTPGDAGGYTTTGNPYNLEANSRTCATIASFTEGTSPGTCKEIFARGFRNPFRFSIQPNMAGIPGTGLPFVGDAGEATWEEVDQVHSGGDYGWPVREGFCAIGVLCSSPQSTIYDDPVYAYSHQVGGGSVVIGGDFYTGGAIYPPQYLNNYFFADYNRGFIARLVYNPALAQWTRPAQDFATNANGVVGIQRGPDGNLYYLTFTSAASPVDGIHRIRYILPSDAAPLRNYFTTDTPTLTWNRVTFATRYVLQVSINQLFTGATTYQVGNNLAFMLPSLPDGYYYWHVAACTPAACGNYSATDTFIIDLP
jgi:glucose/arabinose dehydrogenase